MVRDVRDAPLKEASTFHQRGGTSDPIEIQAEPSRAHIPPQQKNTHWFIGKGKFYCGYNRQPYLGSEIPLAILSPWFCISVIRKHEQKSRIYCKARG